MNLKEITQQRNQSYLFMALSIVHVLYFLSTGQMTMYYVMYLLWWEELIRYFFEMTYYTVNKDKIERYESFERYRGPRFGFLFVLWWLIFAIDGKLFVTSEEDAVFNMKILQFESVWFNTYLLLSLFRASFFWFNQFKSAKQEKEVFIDYSENGLWIMTISIFVGPYFALMFLKPEADFNYDSVLIMALPFVALKMIFEHKVIQAQYAHFLKLYYSKKEKKIESKVDNK